MPTVRSLAIAVMTVGLFANSATAQSTVDTPDQTIRLLVRAIYANDVAAYEQLSLPHPRRARLTEGGRVNEDKLRQLREDPGGLQIRAVHPIQFQGKNASRDAQGHYPVGATGHYVVAHYGSPTVFRLVRQPDGWRVDLRWWIAMTERASGRETPRDSADGVIRSLLSAMIRLNRQAAAALLVDRKNVDVLFAGAPTQREPSGVLEATANEMPLVEIEPGDFYRTPSGRVIEGVKADDRKVVVGWFGPFELPFALQRIDGQWRVDAEPYFALLMQ